jgi:single-strand DNA-binding protein
MANFNKVMMIGRLTRDVELRHVGTDDRAVADISIAIDETYRDNTTVVFVDVTLWGSEAQFASDYLSKGSPVFIEGKLRLDQWEKDGQKRSKLKVQATKLESLSQRPRTDTQDAGPPELSAPAAQPTTSTDEWTGF